MKNLSILFALAFLGMNGSLSAQYKARESESKVVSHIYFMASYFNGGRETPNRWSSYGAGYDLDLVLKKGWRIGLRVHFRNWSERDKFLFPINLGPSYSFRIGEQASIDAFVGAGPSGVVGNDYAGFFAHLSGGMRLNVARVGPVGIFTGFYYSQAMAFHPSAFEHLDVVVGVRF